ncbi:D-alanine--D-alanine ligase family protein [Demequina litorisediminis]|uniref:D-alanine--D-alanine ligase n=1 Tax=Demequina litorisediminis TaxID=1849022 RepID=A0ABQ6IDH9_9MICO|nr:D-alanine--D-alanine ligase [Demequina litorisediminis]
MARFRVSSSLLGVPYVGTRAREARVAWVKSVAKAIFARDGIATPEYVTLPQSLFREVGAEHVISAIQDRMGLPVVVKPARGGSALGVTLVTERDEPQPRAGSLLRVRRHGVDRGRRDRCGGGGVGAWHRRRRRGPSRGGDPGRGAYDYDARYNPGRVEYFAPARLSSEDATTVADAALAVHRNLGLRDLSRVDIILDEQGKAQVIDVNVTPGLTETSLLPQAVEASGRSLGEVYASVARLAYDRG